MALYCSKIRFNVSAKISNFSIFSQKYPELQLNFQQKSSNSHGQKQNKTEYIFKNLKKETLVKDSPKTV